MAFLVVEGLGVGCDAIVVVPRNECEQGDHGQAGNPLYGDGVIFDNNSFCKIENRHAPCKYRCEQKDVERF